MTRQDSQRPSTQRIHAFLLQAEAAGYLRVSERTLERWRLEGTGPPFRRFGRRVVYASEDLSGWAAARSFSSTSEADFAIPAQTHGPNRERRS
jgi:hypothetical protein